MNLVDFIIIPLGNDCSISHFLRAKNLRKFALPFDWNVTPISSAIELIRNGFYGFLEEENLTESKPTGRLLFDERENGLKISNDIITPVLCKKYKMLFPHDFSKKGLLELKDVKSKYQKRIDRLYNILQSDKPVIFIAANNKINKWQKSQYESHEIDIDNSMYKNWKDNIKHVLDSDFRNLKYQLIDLEEAKKSSKNFTIISFNRIKDYLFTLK